MNILVDGVVKARRSRGDFIGEIALIFACDRMADAVAVDDVEVYSLSRRDVLMVAKRFPQLFERLREIGAERMNRQGWTVNRRSPGPLEHRLQPAGGETDEEQESGEWESAERLHLVGFCDQILHSLASIQHDHSAPEPCSPTDVSDLLNELRVCFTLETLQPGAVLVEAGSTSIGLYVLCDGCVEIEDASQTKAMATFAAGSVLGLVTHFFTGKSLSTVRVGAKGAKAWKMTRNTMTLLWEQHPILQDALHERAQELMQCAGNGDSTSAGAQSSLPI